jgi:hypothetical protein
LLFTAALAFYLMTLAPTVLWGDDAMLQRWAAEGYLARGGTGHWVWLEAAKSAIRLPVGDVAYRVNLVSAVAAALTVVALFGAGRALGLTVTGALGAAVSLAVAHTFWTHAVRAEVYTVYTALMALQLWLWFLWRPARSWPLFVAALLFGVTLLGHQMAALLLPALAYLCWRQRRWLTWRRWLGVGLAAVAGALPFLWVVRVQGRTDDLVLALRLYFTDAGADISGLMFDFGLEALPRDAALWVGFLGLQFAGLALLLGLYSLARIRTWIGEPRWQTLLIVYGASVAFAFSYRVNDQFVFYLPSYVAAALFVGLGLDLALQRWRGLATRPGRWALLAALVVMPIVTYFALALVLSQTGINPLGVRALPGRDPNWFFLWPAKQSDYGARAYARAVLEELPDGSLLIADHTPFEPLKYLQDVEGVRPDVVLRKVGAGQALGGEVAVATPGQPVYIADSDLRYTNLGSLPGARLEPEGLVYRLVLPDGVTP